MKSSPHSPDARTPVPTKADAAFITHLYDTDAPPADAEATDLRALLTDLDALPAQRPDADMLERLFATAERTETSRMRLLPLPTHIVRYAVAACLVLAVGLGVLLTRDTVGSARAEALPAWDTQDDIYTITRRLDDLQQQYEADSWGTAVPLDAFGGTAPAGHAPVGYQR